MSRIQRFGTWATVVILAFLFAGEAAASEKRGVRRGGHRRTVADHVVAYAALEALPGSTGWGRFVVRDDLLPSGEQRRVEVSLFGLEAKAEFTIEADGVEVGTIVTDRRGDASVKLKTLGRHFGEVPDELPAANEMLRASVFDSWGATVLDGAFTVIREHITDPIVHREKIHLEPEEGFEAEGMAGVCNKESGAQGFATMASGLEPGLGYSIAVDTVLVGVVTADEEGQAGLELHIPDDENPLPEALQPVENIRTVQWFQGDLLILSGVFTGESDVDDRCDEIEGQFARLTDAGFVLQKGDREVEIVVTDETEFEGFDDLTQLEEGDRLEVDVCRDGDQLVARSVELEEPERECGELHGAFAGLTDNGFVLRKGEREVVVVVTEDTELEGFSELEELEEGDRLEVEGCWDGEQLVAESVELEERERECEELRGVVAGQTDRGFVLQVGDDMIDVVVTEETRFKGFDSLDELDGGEVVALEGCFDGDVLVAAWVRLLEDDDCAELRGVVVEQTDSGFVLQMGDDMVEVVVTEETRFKGFDSLDQLDGGEVVALEGCFDGDVLVAAWVKLLEDDDCVELHGVVAERTDHGFVLQVGDDVVDVAVTDDTELKGFESLDQLGGGEVVALEGCYDGDVLVAVWVCLVEDDDCAEMHGVVAEITDFGFVLQVGDEFVEVAITDETVLKNFDSREDLEIGASVALEGCFDGDILVAAWVRLQVEEPELEWWVADGTVVDLLDYGIAFEADGEVVIVKITDETVLEGYDNADQIAEGDVVLVEGWWDGEKVFAARVMRGGP